MERIITSPYWTREAKLRIDYTFKFAESKGQDSIYKGNKLYWIAAKT